MTQKLIKNPTTETTTKEQFIEKTGLIPCYFISFGETSDPFDLGTPSLKKL